MREQLTQYVNLLFAGNDDVEDIKQEILQNTLDRYDDLVLQGKSPEAAYRLAISGIGDVNEIISGQSYSAFEGPAPNYAPDHAYEATSAVIVRVIRAVAICLYIISPVPLFLMSFIGMDEIGLCGTLLIVAIATALLLIFKKKEAPKEAADDMAAEETAHANTDAQKNLKKSIGSLISTLGLVLYFIVSFATKAWAITWLIFPITGAVKGVVNAALDLKEGK